MPGYFSGSVKDQPLKAYVLGATVFVVVLVSVVMIRYPSMPMGRQAYNMSVALELIEELTPLLAEDDRFEEITLSTYTAQGGCLYVRGSVENLRSAYDLRLVVDSLAPSVPVMYSVSIWPNEDVSDHIFNLKRLIWEDERFHDLYIHIDYGTDTCLAVEGEVDNEFSAQLLRELVETNNPGLRIEYRFTVRASQTD